MIVDVLICGFSGGVLSSPKLACSPHEDISFLVLPAGNVPAHRTLGYFRMLHGNGIAAPVAQLAKLAHKCRSVNLGTVAVNGTKVNVGACRHKATGHTRTELAQSELEAQIEQLLAGARTTDATEPDGAALNIPAIACLA